MDDRPLVAQVRRRADRGSRAPRHGGCSADASGTRCRRPRATVIVVHGGGKEIDAALKAAGIEKRQVEGLRITDEADARRRRLGPGRDGQHPLRGRAQHGGRARPWLTGADASCGLSRRPRPTGRWMAGGRSGLRRGADRGADMQLLHTLDAPPLRARSLPASASDGTDGFST